jgi:hypothetical protein
MLFLLFLGGTKALYKIEVPREGVKGLHLHIIKMI